MLNHMKFLALASFIVLFMTACGESEAPQSSTTAPEATTAAPEAASPATEADTTVAPAEVAAEVVEIKEPAPAGPVTETPVAEEPAAATTASSEPVDGGQVYNTYCAICHRAGMNAAPKHGNKALWAKRIAQGKETMYANAINGLRGMPPRGGFVQLTDEEVKAAVDYMVKAAGGWGDN